MNTAAATPKPATFVKLNETGSYDYGYCVRVGKRDRLDVVGNFDEFEAAQLAALALPAAA
jgi:hypothetical protein